MYPILFKIHTFELYTYGLMMALGVIAGIQVVNREALRNHWNVDQLTRLSVYTFIVGLLGSRVVYVMTRLNEPNLDLWQVAFNLRAGFVYYGGLIAAWLFLVVYIKKYRLPFWDLLDSYALAICIGLALGRIGCLLGGCCYGSSCNLPWAVSLAKEPVLGKLHPVQAYEFIFLVGLFFVMWRRRIAKKYAGELVVWFVGSYAVARYFLEIFRGDVVRGYVIDDYLTTSQFISVPLLLVSVYLHFSLKNQAKS